MSFEVNSLTDNELLEIIRENRNGREGKEAFSELMSRYFRMVLKRANHFSDNCSDVEDLTQDGMLAFYEAVDSFDMSRETKFSAYVCVSNRIRNSAEKIARINSRLSEMDSEGADIPVSDISPENICMEKESFGQIRREINSMLAPLEVKVFSLYLDGIPYREIAQKLGIPEKSVDNAVFRIRKKIKNVLSE